MTDASIPSSSSPRARSLSREAGALLERILRARPAVRPELDGIVVGDDGEALLAELMAAGFVAVDGDRVELRPPEQVVTDTVLGGIGEAQRATAQIADLLAQLPDYTRAWQQGISPDTRAIEGEVIEGDSNALTRWYTLIGRLTPNNPGASHPDLSFIHDHVVPHAERFREEFAAKGFRLRYLFPASAIVTDRDRAAIDVLHRLDAPVRVTSALLSWFYVDRGVMAGLPQTWGATSPGGMVMVYSTPVVEAVSWLFDTLWDSAAPLPVETDGGHGVLELMARGRSDEQIAAVLGLGVRTVRRRIAEAMDRYGVTTRFELGVAWGREGTEGRIVRS
jgi:DNA-binding CsgD family transcriptional regulator